MYVMEVEIPRIQDDDVKKSLFYTARELCEFRREARDEVERLLLHRLQKRLGIQSLEEAKRIYVQQRQAQKQKQVTKRTLLSTETDRQDSQPSRKRQRRTTTGFNFSSSNSIVPAE